MKRWLALAALLAACSTAPAPQPTTARNSLFNPAVSQATIHATICVAGWTDLVRPDTSYTDRVKADEIADLPASVSHDPADYELDHKVPLALGGAPAEPRNLMLELWPEAHRKDTLERSIQLAVCAGNLTLAQGRAVFTGWVENA